jgi:hypothetical protein
MFDGFDRDRLARQARLVLNSAQMRDSRWDFQAAEVRSLKPDAIVGGSRFERQRDLVAGMETNSGARD